MTKSNRSQKGKSCPIPDRKTKCIVANLGKARGFLGAVIEEVNTLSDMKLMPKSSLRNAIMLHVGDALGQVRSAIQLAPLELRPKLQSILRLMEKAAKSVRPAPALVTEKTATRIITKEIDPAIHALDIFIGTDVGGTCEPKIAGKKLAIAFEKRIPKTCLAMREDDRAACLNTSKKMSSSLRKIKSVNFHDAIDIISEAAGGCPEIGDQGCSKAIDSGVRIIEDTVYDT